MKIGVDGVRHIAMLAELAVSDADVERLAAEMDQIVAMAESLKELHDESSEEPLVVGPQRLRLREDVVDQIVMNHPPSEFAPAMKQGFYLVPKLGGLTES